ncbi:Hypothetical predicted protein [Pelobates cultripes]|uniref:Uncharacterized protein n=1 Tax=Pelobates cultripes TaxID=61616 RepID=A0AAD1R8C0_PELCU|nr:Hypothetical predicted protein [Pelobates cultripes]
MSDLSYSRDEAPVTKKDFKELLKERNANMASELAKDLDPIKTGLGDLDRHTGALEDKMEELTSTTSNHDTAI